MPNRRHQMPSSKYQTLNVKVSNYIYKADLKISIIRLENHPSNKKESIFFSQRLLFVVVTLYGSWTERLQQVDSSTRAALESVFSLEPNPGVNILFNEGAPNSTSNCLS